MFAQYFCGALAAAAVSSAIPLTASEPIPPSQDPWYTAPANFEDSAPGAILRLRSAPGNLTTIFNNSAAAYNILYRSTNSHYQPAWDVTTLFVPRNSNASALLSYQIPYNTVDVDGSPSYSLYAPADPTLIDIVNSDIQTALARGWYVNVPDFEGPMAAFAAGVQEGHATLDSVRAALNSGFGLLRNDTRVAMWGYSGGSIASEWAAELQVQYAPELKFAGAALGGLVSNATAVLGDISGTIWAGLLPEVLLGLTVQYPAARDYLVSQLKSSGPLNSTGFLAAENFTFNQAFVIYNGTDIWQYFVDGMAVLDNPLIQDIVFTEGEMGYHGVPEMPLFIYKAIHDEITPIGSTDVLVSRFCDVGADIVYNRNSVGGHLAEETNGDSHAFDFLASVLGGTYEHKGCTIRNVTWNTTDSPL